MVLVAVIVGYVLGVLPFVTPKIIQIKEDITERKNNKKDVESQEEILDEWLNGAKDKNEALDNETSNKVNQEDILKEYLTGEVTKGE